MGFRLYIDESGDHTYKYLDDISHRYLGLSGIAIESEYYRREFQPQLEALEQLHFPHNPDDPLVLHREDIYKYHGAFGVLKDPERNSAWENDFIQFVQTAQFRLFTVVIDKKNHKERYGSAAIHPYNLCLTFLLERYRGFLMYMKAKGDSLAESRGGVEDMELKSVYQRVWWHGTYYISAQEFQKVLSSRQIKIKRKEQNIAGLQLTDLLAYSSKCEILMLHEKALKPLTPFAARLVEAFLPKYDLIGRKLFD